MKDVEMNAKMHCMIVCCLVVCVCSGCSAISQLAYSVGAYIDPNVQNCTDDIGSCSLCGEPPITSQPAVVGAQQVQYAQSDCGHQSAAATQRSAYPLDVNTQIADIRAETAGFRDEIDAVNEQLVQRGQVIVQTRGELDRVRSDVIGLRSNVAEWQSSVQHLHTQIRQRDQTRLSMLGEMSDSLQHLMKENVELR